MNAEHERELMVAVEQIVRPIWALEQTKLRMRRELFAHALEAAEEEAKLGHDGELAVQQAIARLGDSDETRRELQRTVSYLDRCEWGIERFLRQPPAGSLTWHAIKVCVAGSAAITAFWLAVFGLVALLATNQRGDVYVLPIVLTSTMMSWFFLLPMILLTKVHWTLLTFWRDNPRRCYGALGLLAGVALLLVLTNTALYAGMRPLRTTLLGGVLTATALLLTLQPIALLTAGLDKWRRRGAAEWLELDIAE